MVIAKSAVLNNCRIRPCERNDDPHMDDYTAGNHCKTAIAATTRVHDVHDLETQAPRDECLIHSRWVDETSDLCRCRLRRWES